MTSFEIGSRLMQLARSGKIFDSYLVSPCGSEIRVAPSIMGNAIALLPKGEDEVTVSDEFPEDFPAVLKCVRVRAMPGTVLTPEDVGCAFETM